MRKGRGKERWKGRTGGNGQGKKGAREEGEEERGRE